MSSIFISYRRVGALVHARALFERLRHEFGPNEVFIDLEGVDYGLDFVDILNEQLNGCQVMLAMIDPLWATAVDRQGRRRIDRENDYVRTEIVTALSRGIRTVPVLIDGAEMPDPSDLPEPLRPLTRRNALILDFNRFDAEISRLIGVIRRILAAPSARVRVPIEADRTPQQEAIRLREEAARKAREAENLRLAEESEQRAADELRLKPQAEKEAQEAETHRFRERQEAERQAKAEDTAQRAREAEQLRKKQEFERRAKEQEELRLQQEADRKAKEAEALRLAQAAERQAAEESARKAQDAEVLRARQELDLRAREQEAARRTEQLESIRQQQEMERQKKEAESLRLRQEAERSAKEAEELRFVQDAERRAEEKAERQPKEDSDTREATDQEVVPVSSLPANAVTPTELSAPAGGADKADSPQQPVSDSVTTRWSRKRILRLSALALVCILLYSLVIKPFLLPATVDQMLAVLDRGDDPPLQLDYAGRDDPAVAKKVADRLSSSNPQVRLWAASTIGRMKENGAPYIGQLEDLLGDNAYELIPGFAASALANLSQWSSESAAPKIAALLTNSSHYIRASAAEALGNMGNHGAKYAPQVAALLKDPESDVRDAAKLSLAAMGDAGKTFLPN